MANDYNATVNLPKTEFPMRANLPKREPEILKQWQDKDLYGEIMKKNEGKPLFILHDGPPYANGDIHLGHALNKILKDVIIRYKNMSGFKAPYVPGWDTHGLPIELQAVKKLKLNREEVDPITFRKACEEFALGYVNNQKEQFVRLGSIGDYENPYLTLRPEFEAKQIEVFGEMAKKGYIYKGLKPVYWCPDCQTALAEAEIEYDNDPCTSIFVKFRVKDDKGKLAGITGDLQKTYFVIWTTTTWTIPANRAIALNPDFDYAIVSANGEYYIMSAELTDGVMKTAGIEEYEIVAKMAGSEFEYMVSEHPYLPDIDSVIILGDHVTLEAGTGCVHTAPGHGADDFTVGKKYNIPVAVPVDEKGYLTEEAGMFAGLYYEKSNALIIEELEKRGLLLAHFDIEHQYPHCWRCKKPIIFRATEQWFASIDKFRDQAVEEVKKVTWIPAWGEERITGMVRDRYDWCISRQRVWGVPIPIFYCEECGHELINDDTIAAVAALFKKEGSNAWYKYTAQEILPKGTKCSKCGHDHFRKESDIMDVWFDSGSSHRGVLEVRDDLRYPSDMYLEGQDQYRGWFQSSLLTSVATRGVAPYNTVLTHGFVVDGDGKKMSKSLGNVISPLNIIKEYGADILRLWVMSSDYRVDVRLSKDILKQLSESYRKIRNTARFILGNLTHFDPDADMVDFKDMYEIDRWALMRLEKLIKRVREAYDASEYHGVFHAVHGFCVVDMSNFYLDIIKDRLYIEDTHGLARRSAQSAMYKILEALVLLLSPAICFTAEEIWQYMPHTKEHDTGSVSFNAMPSYTGIYEDAALEEKWEKILLLREDAKKALETARASKLIGASLEATVTIFCTDEAYDFVNSIKEDLPTIFIASHVHVEKGENKDAMPGEKFAGISVLVEKASGHKCERCWMYVDELSDDPKHPTLCKRCADIVG
ncbi:MAG: isoleucine--tRNA ligase [Clostridia bacterium]|nr:isoleucine--tRNA ligase [Clostridia bacterium]